MPETYRKEVTIQQPAEIRDSVTGEMVQAWNDIATVSANIESLSSSELVRARAVNHDVTHRVKMRWNETINAKCRLSFAVSYQTDPRYLNITGIRNVDERNVELVIDCTEVR